MKIIDLPKPGGKTIEEKYEYAKFLILCKEPTLSLLHFLEREKDNFTINDYAIWEKVVVIDKDELGRSNVELVWDKGDLYTRIGRAVIRYVVRTGLTEYYTQDCKEYFGFDWASPYEKQFLHTAVDNLVTLSTDRTRLLKQEEEREKNETERKCITLWLEDHEKI